MYILYAYSCGRNAGTLSETHARTDQHCRTAANHSISTAGQSLLSIWNDLPQEFIDKAILSFRKRLRSCVAAAGGNFEHSV